MLERATGSITHRQFRDLVDLVAPHDVVVLNTSRVIPARLRGTREGGGTRPAGGDAEILLVRPLADGTWLAMGHPGGKLKPGRRVRFDADSAVEIVAQLGGGLRRVRFLGLDAEAVLRRHGEVPLPPYIRRPPQPADRERYQTVYAEHDGSVAAPTAGLHFTIPLLERLRARGVALATLDLHVGPGTFKPVESDDVTGHRMTPEAFEIRPAAADAINARRSAGGRVWAVGTTVVRALETAAAPDGTVRPGGGDTALFIHAPYTFRAVDRLITNFHLPRSTLLMLVCAFGGRETVLRAYREAIAMGYRFYSYGDAMVVL